MSEFLLVPLFLVASFAYSSVGLGGGSIYLAIMAAFGVASSVMAPLALSLNCIVASIGWNNFRRQGYFRPKLLLAFVVTSIPAAFIGGLIQLSSALYLSLLGVLLFFTGIGMMFSSKFTGKKNKNTPFHLTALIGAVVGFVSGIVGIGGGIFLTPIMLYMGIVTEKEAAGLSSAFIGLNSASGLTGHFIRGNTGFFSMLYLIPIIIIGGYAGSRIGSVKFDPKTIRSVFGLILIVVSINLVVKNYGLI